MVTRERLPRFTPFFPHVLEVAQPDYTRRDSPVFGVIRTLPRIFFTIYPWLEQETSIVTLMSLRTLGSEPFRVITQQYASSFKSQQIEDTRANIFFPILQQLHDDHRFSLDPFFALVEFKVLLHKAKKMTKRELSRQTPDCIGAKL